ncbi:tripartite tricarboxylate transporter substrate binding protein [Variovorax sp. KK3]|uniref:Bug family tripartite tricarboxylate transporter substrate binding protein n=1 Tax=Variovorax sp. KK3 TaxID=1855728 RepID=UPI00097C0754|nr:tripartite tricarboxylate transporter substrate binding protein [Variovorax sp. KK3]
MPHLRHFARAALLALTCFAATVASADWPEKPIRLIHNGPPGTTADNIARLVADQLSAQFQQPVVVDAKPGANGAIAADAAARSAPDGYTLFLGTNPVFAVNPHLYDIRYDPFNDFVPISQVVVAQNMLVVRSSLPIKNVGELVAYAKANPGKLSYGSSGTGSMMHLSGELFQRATGTELVHVPYKGGQPARMDMLGNNLDLMFGDLGAIPFVKDGRLRALATTGPTREEAMPDVPTLQEVGLKDYSVTGFYLLVAPRGTPAPIVTRLSNAVGTMLRQPDVRQKIVAMGNQPAGDASPAYLAAALRADHARWGKVIKDAGISAK